MSNRTIALVLISLHACLALHASWNVSPAWDEIIYPAAGYDLLVSGHVRTSLDHPPLGKALLALPLFLEKNSIKSPPGGKDAVEPFRFGFDFVHNNRLPARRLLFLSRLTNVLFSCLLAWMIFLAGRSRWGDRAGLLALTFYAFLPAALARASMGLLEMTLAVFMMASCIGFVRWEERRHPWAVALWGIFWLCAVLTKATAWILLPGFLWVSRRKVATLGVTATVLLMAELIMRYLGQSYFGAEMISRGLSAPQASMPIYFAGRVWEHPLPFHLLIAWLIKTPLSLVILAAVGFAVSCHRRRADPLLQMGIASAGMYLFLTIAFRSRYVTTSHLFWFHPFACLAIGSLLDSAAGVKWRSWMIILAVVMAGECFWVHPHYLSYFNALVGGSSHGYHWLDDSDQDWGQGLPALASWMRQENLTQVLLGYAGAGDPRVYGIPYQDVLSPALVTAVYRGVIFPEWRGRVCLALGTKVVQTERPLLEWLLLRRKPTKIVGHTFLIYDLTGDREALEWLIWFYKFTRRPHHAVALHALRGTLRSEPPKSF